MLQKLAQISIPPADDESKPIYTPAVVGAVGLPLVPMQDIVVDDEIPLPLIDPLVVDMFPIAVIVPFVVMLPFAKNANC